MKRIWNSDYGKQYPHLEKSTSCEFLIVGGGICGCLIANTLSENYKDIILIEANRIGNGITCNSTAKLTYLQEDLLLKISKYRNQNDAITYLNSQIKAINDIVDSINTNKIKCDLMKNRSFLYCKTNKKINELKKIERILKDNGVDVGHEKINSSLKAAYSINVDDTYVFNPNKYIQGINKISVSNGLRIYEESRLHDILNDGQYYYCRVNEHMVKTKYLILACHYPYFFFPFLIPFRITKEKCLLRINEVDRILQYNAINIDKPVESIRYFTNGKKSYQLTLANAHNISFKYNKDNKLPYDITNHDIITQDYLPLIGEIKKNCFIATGFNTWGMEFSFLSGQIIKDIIEENHNELIELCNPKRFLTKSTLHKLPICVGSTVSSFFKTYLHRNKSYFKWVNGHLLGVYIDKEGIEHKVKAMCPHAKCHLVFNEIDKTWDCPCHGSKFDIDGNVIIGPANYDIKI